MKTRYSKLLTIAFLTVVMSACSSPSGAVKAGNSPANANESLTEEAEEPEEVYSTSTDFPGADGNFEHVNSSGRYPWSYQALNLKSFYEEGLVGADSATGQLSTDEYNKGLQMYSTFRNTGVEGGDTTIMYPGHDSTKTMQLDWMYAYPAGYKTAYNDGDVGSWSSSWGGYYTASQQWFKVAGGQWIHPGYNVAVATCFFAPRSGTISISDSIYIPSGQYESDGIDIAIYKQPKEYLLYGQKLWSAGDAFGLYGATPVYPTPGVNVTSDYSAGWLHIPTKVDYAYETGAISVEKDDMIVIIYGQHETTTSDTTYTSPTIKYLTKDDSIALDHYNEVISVGETLQLVADIQPVTSQDKTITWTSEDDSIATVSDSGLVTGVSAGTTAIWATLDSGAKAYCLIKVRSGSAE